MLSLVVRALRARRAQSLAMFALALLAALGSAAAPWFLAWSLDAVARANVHASPVAERLITVSGSAQYDPAAGSPVQRLRDQAAQLLPVDGVQTEVGARIFVTARAASAADGGTDGSGEGGDDGGEPSPAETEGVDLYLAYRGGVCDRVTLVDGRCPERDGEALLSRRAAELIGAGVGDRVALTGFRLPDRSAATVSGIYEITDPFDLYWAGTSLVQSSTSGTPDPMLVSERTLLDLRPAGMDIDLHALIPGDAFTDRGTDLAVALKHFGAQLRFDGMTVVSNAAALLDRIDNDRRLVLLGVEVGAAQLMLICWVGLFLAVRHTSEERRADIGLLKLRGAKARRAWLLVGLASGLPVLAGTVLGAVLGFAVAAGLAVASPGTGGGLLGIVATATLDPVTVLWLSLGAAALASLGGFVAAVAAEWRTVRTPVVDLLRHVPGAHRGWRADVVDLVIVVLAAAGVYQAAAEAGAGTRPGPLALLAPALVGLAVALVVARSLPPLASKVGGNALRSGRAGVALAALHLSRRRGVHRIFAVLAVAAAVFTTATVAWRSADGAWNQRAVQELGADRVLTVEADNAAALMAAVRSVDPRGRYAMAVATTGGTRTADRVVAVDSQRYGRVARLPAGMPASADLAALVRPSAPEPPMVADGPLLLDAALGEGSEDVGVRLHLSTVDGGPVDVAYPVLPRERATVQASVGDCASGCRLLSVELVVPPAERQLTAATLEIYGLSQPTGTVLSPEMLGDVTRWRGSFVGRTAPPVLRASGDRLEVILPAGAPPGSLTVDARVMPLSVPAPLPVVLAGPGFDQAGGDTRISALGGADVPFQVMARVPVLPGVGDRGVLVDLEYALRSNDAPTEAVDLSVWLTADAPDTLVGALADQGITVLGDESVTGRTGDLASYGPGLALRFEYFAAAIVLLVAAGVAVVGSTVDRSERVAELAALRGQGLRERAVRVAGYAGTATLVGVATVTGVVAALLAHVLVSAGLPIFSDDWQLLPSPSGLTPLSLLLALAVVGVVIGAASLWGSARLVTAVRDRGGGGDAT